MALANVATKAPKLVEISRAVEATVKSKSTPMTAMVSGRSSRTMAAKMRSTATPISNCHCTLSWVWLSASSSAETRT